MSLKFTWGCMGSGKSAMLVMQEFNFRSRGYETVVMKPKADTRDEGIIKPRPMEGLKVDILYGRDDNLVDMLVKHIMYPIVNINKKFVVFVDEIQFSTKEQIKQLWNISSNICDVYVYGLKVNYLNELFEPIPTLIVHADKEEELEVGCKYCHGKANTHLLYMNDKLVLDNITENDDNLEIKEIVEKYHDLLNIENPEPGGLYMVALTRDIYMYTTVAGEHFDHFGSVSVQSDLNKPRGEMVGDLTGDNKRFESVCQKCRYEIIEREMSKNENK